MLKPNETYKLNGVTVNEKIIPIGTVWQNDTKAKAAGFRKGQHFKKEQKLNYQTGVPNFITVHNTGDYASVNDDAEYYVRATYNENMSSARVHFYVDDLGVWQELCAGTGLCKNDPIGSAEVGWHAGDGSNATGGNYQSIALEIIMGNNAEDDAKAYDNGARIIAWLLYHYKMPLSTVVTHTYWVNKMAGKHFTDVDEQSTNMIKGKKWCPYYIFGGNNVATAKKNWKKFKTLIQKYLDELEGKKPEPTPDPKPVTPSNIKVGDIVEFVGTKHYTNPTVLTGKTCKPGEAKVTDIATSGKHIIHVVHTKGSKSTVYGWVDEKDILTEKSTDIMLGDKVRLKSNATIYNKTKKFSDWIYKTDLYVRAINKTKVTVSIYKSGAITGNVDIKYLTKII